MVRFNVRNVLTMEIFRQKGSDMEEKHQTLKELPVSERPLKSVKRMEQQCCQMQNFWQ